MIHRADADVLQPCMPGSSPFAVIGRKLAPEYPLQTVYVLQIARARNLLVCTEWSIPQSSV